MASYDIDLCLIPAGTPPAGTTSNLVDPPSLQWPVIAVATVFTTLSVIVTSGRLFVNRKSWNKADYFMVIGLIFDIATMSVIVTLSPWYRHIWDIPACWFNTRYMKLVYAEVMLVGPALFFPKVSIFLFYLQLFGINRTVRLGAKIGIVGAFLAYFPATLVLSYYDAPHIGQTWESLLTSDLPIEGIPGGISIGCLSVVVDLYVFILPISPLLKLKMPLSKRIQLVALFSTALMGLVASVVCMVFRIKLLGLNDSAWQSGKVAIPILIENNVAIIVGSMPAFASFLRNYGPDLSFFRSLRSRLMGGSSKGASSFGSSRPLPPKPSDFDSSPPSKEGPYYELSDAGFLESQITATQDIQNGVKPGNDGIYRSVELMQSQEPQVPSDRLV